MDTNLFTERSLWTMIHGIVLSGAALMALSAALFSLHTIRAGNASETVAQIQSRYLVGLTVFTAAMLWLTVLVGTYVVFPPYRAVPPEGLTPPVSQGPASGEPGYLVAAFIRDGNQGTRTLDLRHAGDGGRLCQRTLPITDVKRCPT